MLDGSGSRMGDIAGGGGRGLLQGRAQRPRACQVEIRARALSADSRWLCQDPARASSPPALVPASVPFPAGRPPRTPRGRRNRHGLRAPGRGQSAALRGTDGRQYAQTPGPMRPPAFARVHSISTTTVRLLPPQSSPAPPPQEQLPSPRPALTSQPLGVVLGRAEWGLRPKASVNHSITSLEIRSCG